MPRQARLDAPGTLHHVMIRGMEGKGIFRDTRDRKDFVTRTRSWPGLFWRTMFMDFESKVWDCDGGGSEEVRGLHLGHRQGNSKKGGGGLKVLVFHYVPQSRNPQNRGVNVTST